MFWPQLYANIYFVYTFSFWCGFFYWSLIYFVTKKKNLLGHDISARHRGVTGRAFRNSLSEPPHFIDIHAGSMRAIPKRTLVHNTPHSFEYEWSIFFSNTNCIYSPFDLFIEIYIYAHNTEKYANKSGKNLFENIAPIKSKFTRTTTFIC